MVILADWTQVVKRRKPVSTNELAYKVRTKYLVLSPPAFEYLGESVELYFRDDEGALLIVSTLPSNLNAYKLSAIHRSTSAQITLPPVLRDRLPDTQDWIRMEVVESLRTGRRGPMTARALVGSYPARHGINGRDLPTARLASQRETL